jgi:hypothetical protein
MIRKRLLWISAVVLLLLSCARENADYEELASDPEYFHRSMKQLTDVIVHDIFSPPVASRIYAYASIAGYEAALPAYPECQSLSGQLNQLAPTPAPEAGKTYCFPLASTWAMLTVGRALIFSEEKMDAFQQDILASYRQMGIPEAVVQSSKNYGEAVATHILAWAAQDNYKQTRSYPKYTISDAPATWKPTPPAYMDGIEPSWNQIRPFALDSAQQFKPAPPTSFNTDKNSRFYQEMLEVYRALDAKDKEERIAIAQFWDCNPYVSHHVGHVMYATKKITPGGHWINIARVAATQAKANFMQSLEAYTLTSIALADGFISCWDEKYRSQLVRPETVINQYLDEDWRPLLQTPPFPEYTSGHSVISNAAATALTTLFGDNFAYTDDTEEEFGLPARQFRSFFHAAEEAAVSRLYGGIHYMPAITNGVEQGKHVGKWVVRQVKLRKEAISKVE